MISLDGSPADWVSAGGRPAPVLDEFEGLPSYESDDGEVVVLELCVMFTGGEGLAPRGRASTADGGRFSFATTTDPVMIPRDYGVTTLRQAVLDPESAALVPLHDEPGARWWRPLLWQIRGDGFVQRLGSQTELEWRNGLAEAQRRTLARREVRDAAREGLVRQAVVRDAARHVLEMEVAVGGGAALEAEDLDFRAAAQGVLLAAEAVVRDRVEEFERSTPWEFTAAAARAERTLREHLTEQQRLDLEATGRFFVWGQVNRLYAVSPGNGLAVVDPATRETRVSLCLHPESWIPSADVALAHKLLIESGPEGERELLAGARRYPSGRRRPATAGERRAAEMERWLDQPPATLVEPAQDITPA